MQALQQKYEMPVINTFVPIFPYELNAVPEKLPVHPNGHEKLQQVALRLQPDYPQAVIDQFWTDLTATLDGKSILSFRSKG